jgi:DHA1 family tetracycline resistance protein-like MFS transporter
MPADPASFEVSTTARELQLPATTCSGPRWWKLIPIEILKLGGLLLIIPSLTNIKKGFFGGNTEKAAAVQSVSDSLRSVFTMLVIVQMGQASDTVGRRPLIILSIWCTLMPLLCLAIFPDQLYYYFVVFTLSGLLGGQVSPASKAYIVDCSSDEDRAKIFGLQGAVISGVVAVTPALAGLIANSYGQRVLRITAAVVVSLDALVAVCLLPESLPRTKRQAFAFNLGCNNVIETLRQLVSRRGSFLWDMAVCRFVLSIITGVPSFLAFTSILDMKDADFALLMTISSTCGILVQTLIFQLAIRRGCSNISLIAFSFAVRVCVFGGFSLLPLFAEKWFLFSLTAFLSLDRMYAPAFDALITQGGKDDKGFVLGAFAAVDSVSSIVSPLVMGSLYQVSRVAPFILVALLNLLCFVSIGRIRSRMKTPPDGDNEAFSSNTPYGL